MNRCESINSMELNESKRTFSLSSIHKNFHIYKKRVENDCYVNASQPHQCNSWNISENRKFTHRKQRNTRHSTKQLNVTRPVCVKLTLLSIEVSKRKKPNNTKNWEQF